MPISIAKQTAPMTMTLGRRTAFAAVLCVALAAAFVVLNLRWLSLSTASLFAEKRPALLQDARWNEPSSAQKFQKRFRPGVPERELIEWLRQNAFVAGPWGHASKLIHSLPCSEVVNVDWTSSPAGQLRQATAQVSEAGCL